MAIYIYFYSTNEIDNRDFTAPLKRFYLFRSEGPLMEFEEEEEEEEQDKEMEYGTEEEEELEPNTDTEEEEVSDASPESSHGWSGSELLETPEESLQESEGEEDLYFEDIDESQSSPSETESTKSVMKVTIDMNGF